MTTNRTSPAQDLQTAQDHLVKALELVEGSSVDRDETTSIRSALDSTLRDLRRLIKAEG